MRRATEQFEKRLPGAGASRRAEGRSANCGAITDAAAENWLRGLDSNQDNQLQRLACYQLHYPGKAETFYFTIASLRRKSSVAQMDWLQGNTPDPVDGAAFAALS